MRTDRPDCSGDHIVGVELRLARWWSAGSASAGGFAAGFRRHHRRPYQPWFDALVAHPLALSETTSLTYSRFVPKFAKDLYAADPDTYALVDAQRVRNWADVDAELNRVANQVLAT